MWCRRRSMQRLHVPRSEMPLGNLPVTMRDTPVVIALAIGLVACGTTAVTLLDASAERAQGSRADDARAEVDGVDGNATSPVPVTIGQAADSGRRLASCDGRSCPNGCCTPDGLCSSPPTDTACGFGGERLHKMRRRRFMQRGSLPAPSTQVWAVELHRVL